ncbi:LUD domain-containing protein [Shewanella amazonensis]|uniref:LUD domain-containing protein n=1 Tax=Shewanella amazonensis (strain ATCC BAA-1098 / SB2B) TaxID=326297 RepID=A1S8E1_SHEAM|nr:LUD domain-containing protein [Shewanella amazonensis]ABM00648.1 conserved hypothetical protein [Shewanella amazonensis SB2B]
MSKQAILEALKSSAMEKVAMPTIDIAPVTTDLKAYLAQSLATVAGRLEDGGLAALNARVLELMAGGNKVLSTLADVPGNHNGADDPHGLADVDFAVIKGEFAVAENGAVWVAETALSQRIAPFICENLLLVVEKDAIVANMHEAMTRLGKLDPSLGFGVFIAGPSKTADIEQALVVGAHGACSLSLYLV